MCELSLNHFIVSDTRNHKSTVKSIQLMIQVSLLNSFTKFNIHRMDLKAKPDNKGKLSWKGIKF